MIRCLHEGKKVLLSTNLPNHFTKRDYSTPRDSLLRIFLRVNFFLLFPDLRALSSKEATSILPRRYIA